MTSISRAHLAGIALLLSLAGCRHQVHVAPAPLMPVATTSVPPPTHVSEPLPPIATEDLPPVTLQLPRQPLPRFRPRPTTTRQLALLLPPLPPTTLALGVLSTDDGLNERDLRQQTESLLKLQQQRLSNLTKASASLHAQQVEQARLFMRQALDAWRNRDAEGARVLAMKTKLLLDEM